MCKCYKLIANKKLTGSQAFIFWPGTDWLLIETADCIYRRLQNPSKLQTNKSGLGTSRTSDIYRCYELSWWWLLECYKCGKWWSQGWSSADTVSWWNLGQCLVTELWGGGGPLAHYEHVHTWVMPILFPAPYHPIFRGFLLGWPIYMLNDAQSKKYLPYLSIFLGTC